MKTLFLVRHGKSSWSDTDLADEQRPLNKRGRRQAFALASALQEAGAFAGTVYVSFAERAQETARGLIEASSGSPLPRIKILADLYTFDQKRLLDWLQSQPSQSPVTIVGHNPALLDLANRLLDSQLESLPTGAAVRIDLPGTSWRQVGRQSGQLKALFLPEHLDYKLFRRKAPEPPELAHTPLGERIPAALAHQARLIDALLPGVREGADPEFLHQFRVNLRKSRAIAEALERVQQGDSARKGIKRLKKGTKGLQQQGQATSALRDLDVFQQTLAQWRDDPDRRSVIDGLEITVFFAQKQRREKQRLRAHLDSDTFQKDIARWWRMVFDGGITRLTKILKPKRIRRTMTRQIQRHDRLFRELTDAAPDDDFHRVRKALKRVRYVIELDPDHLSGAVKGLKKRQKHLGLFQDCCAQMMMLEDHMSHISDPDQGEQLSWLIDQLRAEKTAARRDILALSPLQR